MEKIKFCIKCEYSLRQWFIESLGQSIGFYCDNKRCNRYGLLTNIWFENE